MADATQPKSPRACANCLSELADNARFCALCGSPAPVAAPPAQDPVRDVLKVALGRQYEIQRLLGKGGMGAVYLATEAALERDVAIKVLPPDRGATKDSRDRFRREARTAAKLSHPNIVPLYTFGDVDGTLYFVMGYVKGESLAARLKREGRLPVEEARRILIELCDALDYAHTLGIVHRDLKPDNVLLEEGTGRAMLLDFGVAKALGAGQTMTEVGSVLGTPQYMSPEQAQGKSNIDHRSDLYSLAVMGYAMLSGRLPFEGTTAGDVMAQHITKEAPPLKTHAPDAPGELASALARCLAKDPGQRWPDAKSLRSAISLDAGDEKPAALDGLGAFVILPALGTVAMLYVTAWYLGGGDVAPPFAMLPLMVATVGLLPVLLLPWRWRHLRQLGFEPARIKDALIDPIRSFPGWYPRAWRAEGDVWARLPNELRQLRAATGWFWAWLLVLAAPALVFEWARRSHGGVNRLGERGFDVLTLGALAVPALILGAFAVRWELVRRRRGIDPYLASRMLSTPTTRRSFWARPEVAAALLPPSDPGRAIPVSPQELASAILNAALSLKGPAGEAARSAALQLQRALTALDGEIAASTKQADPAELQRLSGRLEALGSAAANEDDGSRQMRELIEKQVALLRGFLAKSEQLRADREKKLGLLQSLWRRAEEARAAGDDRTRATLATRRLQEACAEAVGSPGGAALDLQATEAISDAPTIERS